MNSITCAICGATLQTSGDVYAEAGANGLEIADGGVRCKKCRMAGNSGKFREIPGFRMRNLTRWKGWRGRQRRGRGLPMKTRKMFLGGNLTTGFRYTP